MNNNFGINKEDKSLLDIYQEVESASVTPDKKTPPIKDKIVSFEDTNLKMKLPNEGEDIPGLFPPNPTPPTDPSRLPQQPAMDNESALKLEFLLRMMVDKYMKQGMSLEEAQKQAQDDALTSVSKTYQQFHLDPTDQKNAPKAVEIALVQFYKSQGISPDEALNQAKAAGIVFSAAGLFMSWVNDMNAIDTPPVPPPKDALYNAGINAAKNGLDIIDTIRSTVRGNPSVSTDDKNTIINFMNVIGDAINKIKQLLIEIQIQDSQKAGEIGQQKQDFSELRFNTVAKQLIEQFDQLWDAAHQPWWMAMLKILIPVLTVLVAIIISAATLGSGSPAAAIMAALIITATTTALSETGVLAKAMSGMMSGLVNALKKAGASDAVANIFAAIIIAVIVAIVAIAAPAAGGRLASEAAKAAVESVVKMVVFQLALTFVLTSNAISNLVLGCWLADGKDKDDKDLQKVQMIVAVIFAILVMVVAGKLAPSTGTSSTAEGRLADLAKWCGEHSEGLKNAARVLQAGAGGMSFTVSYVNFESLQRQGKMALSIAELEAIVTLLNMMVTQLQSIIDELLTHGSDKGKEAAGLTSSWENMLNNMQGSISQLFNAA